MSSTERQRARRAELRAAGRCLCGAALLPEWGAACPECRAAARASRDRYRATPRARAAAAAHARRVYHADADAARQRARDARLARKIAGVCAECSAPAEDSNLCPTHRARHRARQRRMKERT